MAVPGETKRDERRFADLLRLTDPRRAGGRFNQLAALHRFIQVNYGLQVVTRSVCRHHQAPFEYLAWSFLDGSRDSLVWANRGGGKTELGSISSHLDAIFKPGCQIRILGGSAEQSRKMYEALCRKWDRYQDQLIGRPLANITRLKNGSTIEALTQSPKSVRGMRVQKLKCDELDEFDPAVWQAVQFTTMSKGGIPATLEAFSTMHKPSGLMYDYVLEAASRGIRTFKWCILETMKTCRQNCSTCPMHGWCGGRARDSQGYIEYADVLKMFVRSTQEAWEAEMMCERPNLSGLVYKEFVPALHVIPDERPKNGSRVWAAVDFGYANPFVCLVLSREDSGVEPRVVVHGEYYSQGGHAYVDHAARMTDLFRRMGPQWPVRIWGDTDHQGCRELSRLGHPTMGASLAKGVGVVKGIEVVRELLMRSPETGRPRLYVCQSCRNLIAEFMRYSWSDGSKDAPEKEHDHALDALRYGIVSECADMSHNLPRATRDRLTLQAKGLKTMKAATFGDLDRWRRQMGVAKLPKPDKIR